MRHRLVKVGSGLGVAALLWAATVVLGPSGAGAASTALCGQTILVSTTLTDDVGPCPNGGITIGANNITLNLNGRTIFGTPDVGDGAGVYLLNRTGVTVTNGTVRDFDGGVVIEGGSGNTVRSVVARDNIGEDSFENVTQYGEGILLLHSSNNRLLQNVAEHNGPYAGISIVGSSSANQLQGNVSQYNNLPFARGDVPPEEVFNEDSGLRLVTLGFGASAQAPTRNIVSGNSFRFNGFNGITVSGHDNQFTSNAVDFNGFQGSDIFGDKGNGIQILGRSFRNVVTGNRVTNNAKYGIRIEATLGTPQNPIAAVQSVITRNVVIYNGSGSEEDLSFDLSDGNRFCDQNVWSQNVHFTEDDAQGSDCLD